jgi:signal transduction histidine kinase
MKADEILSETSPRRLRPSILQKGLGLILVPLLLQGVLFWQFYNLIGKTEELTKAEARQSLLVEQLNKVVALFTAAWGTILTETLDSNQIGAIDPQTYRKQVDEGLAKLRALSPTAGFNKLIADTQELSSRQYELLNECSQTDPNESSVAIYAKYRKIKLTLRPYMRKALLIEQALSAEREKLNYTQKLASESRDLIKMQLVIGVTLDIVLTLALLVFLLKSITDRLAVLVNNARLLPTGQPLPAMVKGSDELAYLDQVLHQASSELEKASEYRKAVMETMNHDLRSPIQSAIITAEILESLPLALESEQTAKQIDRLKRSLSRVVKLVEDHLTIDKLESGTAELEISTFDLRAAVDEAIDGVAAQAGVKSIELENKVAATKIEADRGRILQVLANYLTNAVKYSPRSAPVVISSQHLGHSVKVMIVDDGPGLNAEEQALVYERFQQNPGDNLARQGFGLGLAICKLLVNHHGGTVGVSSSPGKGSTFWFTLPIKYTGLE